MDLELKGCVALVTGASAGIGHSAARVLAAEGAQTVIVARREELIRSLHDEIRTTGALAPMVVCADLTERDSPAAVANAYCRPSAKWTC